MTLDPVQQAFWIQLGRIAMGVVAGIMMCGGAVLLVLGHGVATDARTLGGGALIASAGPVIAAVINYTKKDVVGVDQQIQAAAKGTTT